MDGASKASLLRELVSSYNGLNPATIEELDSEPSPLEFMRFVARNTPFVTRGAASSWKACRKWKPESLAAALGDQGINVAITPSGNADAPTEAPPGSSRPGMVFAKPHEESQSFVDFLAFVTHQEREPDWPGGRGEVRYSQTQNDNLREEYLPLFSDVQRDIPFARIALQKDPDAINLWIGNSRSVTALHRDNYENIYVQVLGRKHFVLLSPVCHPCVNEQALRPATYTRRQDGQLELRMDERKKEGMGNDDDNDGDNDDDDGAVPFALWDPDNHLINSTEFSGMAQPVRVTLEPGDMLYLPAMWYHKVSQSCSSPEEGIVVAVNYWYDMEFSGPLYSLCSLVRDLTLDMTTARKN